MKYFAIAAVALAAGFSVSASAHHSGAMFDSDHPATLDGTVKEFQWSNPHAVIWVMRKGAGDAAPELWSVELTSPGNLTRMGWSKRTVQPGDHVVLEISPLKSGDHGGGFRKLTLDTGQVITTNLYGLDMPEIK